MLRRIETLGKTNKAKLREFFEYKNRNQAKRDLKYDTDNDAYEFMKYRYKEFVDDERESAKQKAKELAKAQREDKKIKAKASKQAFNSLPLIHSNPMQNRKLTREERLESEKSGKAPNLHTIENKDRQNHHRKALNGMFEEQVYMNVDRNDLFDLINDMGLEKLKTMDKTKNSNFNVFISFQMYSSTQEENRTLSRNSHFAEKIVSPTQLREFAEAEVQKFWDLVDRMTKESNLVFEKMLYVQLQFSVQNKIREGSFIELSDFIKRKKCFVNIKNDDN